MAINNILGMLIGAEFSERDGKSGVKGALEGYVVEAAVRALVPVAVTFAIGWGVQFLARRAIHAVTGDPALEGKPAANG